MLPFLLAPDEVAAVLRTTRKGVYALARRERLPATRLGRRMLIRRDDLLSWLDSMRKKKNRTRRRQTAGKRRGQAGSRASALDK